jgi:hypothetical protein
MFTFLSRVFFPYVVTYCYSILDGPGVRAGGCAASTDDETPSSLRQTLLL